MNNILKLTNSVYNIETEMSVSISFRFYKFTLIMWTHGTRIKCCFLVYFFSVRCQCLMKKKQKMQWWISPCHKWKKMRRVATVLEVKWAQCWCVSLKEKWRMVWRFIRIVSEKVSRLYEMSALNCCENSFLLPFVISSIRQGWVRLCC